MIGIAAWLILVAGIYVAIHALIGLTAAAVYLALSYLVFGLFIAATKVDWRNKRFLVRWLPPTSGLNPAVASSLIFGLVVLLWPFYARLARICDHDAGHDGSRRLPSDGDPPDDREDSNGDAAARD